MADQIKLTIDSVEVEVPTGATILEAARGAGIEIPHLCYDPDLGLPPSASCRLCLVELNGSAAPVASCAFPAADGMVVRTDTEELREVRRSVVELLLSDHDPDCSVCAKSGDCALEEYAYRLGVRERSGERPPVAEPAADAPTMLYNRGKCVLCGRCVSVCHGVQSVGAIDFYGRGYETQISLPPELTREQSDCELCGNCVAVCPTGAVGASRMSDLTDAEKVRTTCGFCGVGCQFDLNVKDGRVVGVTSAWDAPVNNGWLCVKGRFGYEFMNHPDRLTRPLVKCNGRFEETSWDEALSLVAERLTGARDEYGPDSVGFISSSRCTNEENYLVGKMARAVIGTNSVDQCART